MFVPSAAGADADAPAAVAAAGAHDAALWNCRIGTSVAAAAGSVADGAGAKLLPIWRSGAVRPSNSRRVDAPAAVGRRGMLRPPADGARPWPSSVSAGGVCSEPAGWLYDAPPAERGVANGRIRALLECTRRVIP
jgi:hypothetical protein